VPILVSADRGAATDTTASLGVPFARGALKDARSLALFDARGAPVPRDTQILARWPSDGSIRSVLVAFKATLGPAESALFRMKLGPGGALASARLAAAPDGPFTATLPASFYAAAAATGPLVPAGGNTRFPRYEAELERGLLAMRPPYDAHGVDCEHTTNHRSYYDGPHAFFQRFARAPSPATYRRARVEATLYRAQELRFQDGMAVQICEAKDWTPRKKLDWATLRRMLGQGMLDDWLLTGDPAARDAVTAMGEALRRDLPTLVSGRENTLRVTERNMAWTLLGLAAYYTVDPRPDVKQAMASVVDDAVAWQAGGKSGAFEHDIARADPDECERGPRGASPFMTSLLVDALMDYWMLTGDARVAAVVSKVAKWYERDAVTSDGRAFRYLWGCEGDPNDDSGVADLNLLIVHVFGAAFALTGDKHWLAFGDRMADSGIQAMQTTNPKQWNQAARSFARYMGYRARGLPP
jgi:hypothetical protein